MGEFVVRQGKRVRKVYVMGRKAPMWNKQLVQLLISKYRKYDHLYNTKNPQYLYRNARIKSLNDICKALKKINRNITVNHIKKKIHTLRTQYLKELRELNKNKEAGCNEKATPKLWCFKQLAFLETHCVVKGNYTANEIDEEVLSNDPEANELSSHSLDYEEVHIEFESQEDSEAEDLPDRLWSKEMLELLLRKYQQYPNLYNKKHPHYFNNAKKSKSIQDICKSLNRHYSNITEEDINNEIHKLTMEYREDLTRLEKRPDLKPKLWCYDLMEFLRPYYCNNLKDLEINENDESDNKNANEVFIEYEFESPTGCNKNLQSSKDILRYLRCGEILIASSCDYKDPYILKCNHCGDIYSVVESFLNHCIGHFQMDDKNELKLKDNHHEQPSKKRSRTTNEVHSIEIEKSDTNEEYLLEMEDEQFSDDNQLEYKISRKVCEDADIKSKDTENNASVLYDENNFYEDNAEEEDCQTSEGIVANREVPVDLYDDEECMEENPAEELPTLKCQLKDFKDSKLYKLHAQRHLNALSEKCLVGGKRFAKPADLKKHHLTHTKETTFCCELCGASYRNKSTLIAHIRRHRKELPSKRLHGNERLFKHKNMHSSTGNYCCDICGKSFKSMVTLNGHRAGHRR
ncbi:zinc finger protein 90 homolog [Musca vetustissima]|uniref:zinc finger protein 90 homolog n=1 Tax=Musca vetustissima TaxID=27455 RepID=UPI002AB76010|nr:zinc finger protein 90 homolog [Musca vetustissima]